MRDEKSLKALVRANAKLTLTLKAMPKIAEGPFMGYHPIEAEMVSLDLADTLEISPGDGFEVVGRYADKVPADNLVTKTFKILGIKRSVVLTKNIPPGGGLGGGSTDAAAVIRWAMKSGDRNLENAVRKLSDDPGRIALELGADVPFCIGGGRAQVSGIGEETRPKPYLFKTFLIFILPFGISTAAVYEKFDQLDFNLMDQVPNNLIDAACEAEPRLKHIIKFIQRKFGIRPNLAGSGSTLFYELVDNVDPAGGVTDLESDFGKIQILKCSTVNSARRYEY